VKRQFNQLVRHAGKDWRVLRGSSLYAGRKAEGKSRKFYDLATVIGGKVVFKNSVAAKTIKKSRSGGKGRGWHGDSAGHSAARKKAGGYKRK
jgi:hypothetical protein